MHRTGRHMVTPTGFVAWLVTPLAAGTEIKYLDKKKIGENREQ